LHRRAQYEGVRLINIYLLRLIFILMFFVLGKDTWTHILTHRGSWEPDDAMAWCVWAAFATLAGLGILRPLKMLPIGNESLSNPVARELCSPEERLLERRRADIPECPQRRNQPMGSSA
jgi:hypothetical protein